MDRKTLMTGLVSSVAGIIVSSALARDFKTIGIVGLTTLPVSAIAYLVADVRYGDRLRKSASLASESSHKLSNRQRFLKDCQAELEQATDQLGKIKSINNQLASQVESLSQHLKLSQNEREELTTKVASLTVQIERLQEEIEAWESEFHSRVETAANERFQKARNDELDKIFNEHDTITQEALGLLKRLQRWGEKVAVAHDQKREVIHHMADSYNANILELKTAVDRERDSYLEQIDLLNLKVSRLQRELAGDLNEPVYGEFGFDVNGKIANAIARELFAEYGLILAVKGFQIKNDVIEVGYGYSRSSDPQKLVAAIKNNSDKLAKRLGLWRITNVKKLAIADILAISYCLEAPRKAAKGSLYRSRESFIEYILNQPTRLRIVGEPGSGKTPTTQVLLSHLLKRGFLSGNTPNGVKLSHTIIEYCNPLFGISVKNSDELDFCLKWTDGKAGFKGLRNEYKFRKDAANSAYKDAVGYIWVCDETDVVLSDLTKDEAKPFKDCLKDGGHVNMGAIVMGQSANVSTTKGLSIDDQKMMTNIYIDPVSIRTFLTQYGERFYGKQAIEKALSVLEEIELEMEEQNAIICDTAREFRVAMVVADRSPVFYQLPYFDGVQIDRNSYQKTLIGVTEIKKADSLQAKRLESLETLSDKELTNRTAGMAENLPAKNDKSLESLTDKGLIELRASLKAVPMRVLACPDCNSHNLRKNGVRNGIQKYRCKDCGRQF